MSLSSLAEPLLRLLGENRARFAKEDLLAYAFDGAAGLRQAPIAVVFPETSAEVAEVLSIAASNGVSVATRGSGTGLSGGSVPAANALVLCLSRMNRLLEIDQENLVCRAEAGVITKRISEAVEPLGLFYPPDPGSMAISTIGGNVANNSGGLRGLKYGVTRDYVMGMQVVLANSEIIWLGNKCVKDVAGYSLKDLFVGSEGTLGVITQVLLKLLPRPASRHTLLALFDSMEDAAEAVSRIIAARIIPCALEFIDRYTLQCVEAYARVGLPTDCEALLLIEADGHAAQTAEEATRIEGILRAQRARDVRSARDRQEADALAHARRSAFAALARIRPTTILEDITVPRSKLAEMIRFVQQTARGLDLKIATFGHFGDGNLHPTILTDERDAKEMRRVRMAMDALFEKALELGGTITGEHGVGLAKKAHLPHQFKDHSFELLKQLKRTLDPANLLNPGKLFDV